jgi:hypothetical protein
MINDSLTDDQIRTLSRNARCCFYLASWNNSFTFINVDDWAEKIGWCMYQHELSTFDEDKLEALNAANKLIALVNELVYL